MKYFIYFQLFLYACIPVLIICQYVNDHNMYMFRFILFVSALVIGPVQYVSAFILLLKRQAQVALAAYLVLASAILLVLYSTIINIDRTGRDAVFVFYLAVTGLILGLAYIGVCRKIGKS